MRYWTPFIDDAMEQAGFWLLELLWGVMPPVPQLAVTYRGSCAMKESHIWLCANGTAFIRVAMRRCDEGRTSQREFLTLNSNTHTRFQSVS